MAQREEIIEMRAKLAMDAIRASVGTPEAEDGVDGFISHHLEQLEPEWWMEHLGTSKPTPNQVLGLLTLRYPHPDDDPDVLDFTLPDDVTQYVVAVKFDEQGRVEAIDMES